jgi:hypothetical protein
MQGVHVRVNRMHLRGRGGLTIEASHCVSAQQRERAARLQLVPQLFQLNRDAAPTLIPQHVDHLAVRAHPSTVGRE